MSEDDRFWEEDEPPFEDEPGAWHKYELWGTHDDIMVIVHESTNDDDDLGCPSTYAHWQTRFYGRDGKTALTAALEHCGITRQGIGCSVEVYFNGQPYYGEVEAPNTYQVTSRFINLLIVFAVIMVIVWTAFGAFVLPLIPHGPVRASVALLGFGGTFILAALLLLKRYEGDIPDDDDKL